MLRQLDAVVAHVLAAVRVLILVDEESSATADGELAQDAGGNATRS